MKKTILFLGGSGFIGKSLIAAFIEKKIENFQIGKILLVSNKNKFIKKISNKSKNKKNIEIITENLLKIKDLPFADYVVYAAEYVDPNKILKKFKSKEDIKTLNNVFKILQKKKFKNSKILYISSGAVYQKRNKGVKLKFNENSKIHNLKYSPRSISEIYVRNKLLGEKFTKKLSFQFKRKTSIARCFTFIGKFYPLKSHYVLGNFIDSVLNKKPIKINDASSKYVYRSFLYSDELINLLLEIIVYSNNSTPIFNVGSEKEISIWNLARLVSKSYKIKFIYPKQNKDKFDYYVPNIGKLKKTFNYKEKLNLKNSIAETIKNINLIS